MYDAHGRQLTQYQIISQLPDELRLHQDYRLEVDTSSRNWSGASLKHHSGTLLLTMLLRDGKLMVTGVASGGHRTIPHSYDLADPQLLDNLQALCDTVVNEHQAWWHNADGRRASRSG